MMRTPIVVTTMFLALGAAACEFEKETFKYAPSPSAAAAIEKVITTNDIGDVTVRPSSSKQPVLVVAEAEWLTERPVVKFKQEGTTLYVAATCIDDPGCRVDITLDIPERMPYEVHGEQTNITASSLAGAAVLSSEVGDFVLDTLTGSVDLKAGEGEILGNNLQSPSFVATMEQGPTTLSFTGGAENVSIKSDAGRVDLVVPPTSYQIDASTGSGELDIQVPESDLTWRKLAVHTRRGNVTVKPQAALIHEPIEIKVGQTIRFADQPVSITFDGVVEDSRCPIKTSCAWGGRLVVAMSLTMKDGTKRPFEASLDRPVVVAGYDVQIMQARPFVTQGDAPPAEEDYVLTFALDLV